MSNKVLKPKKASLYQFIQNYSNNIGNCIEFFKSMKWPRGNSSDRCGCHKYYLVKRVGKTKTSYVLESSSCLVPPQAVETAVNMQLQQMAASFAQQGVAMEQYLQMTGKTMDSLKDELKPVAQKQAKLEAVLDEIIRVENITVSDEEMDEQYELISQKYGQPVDVVKQVLPKAQLKPDLLRMKASQLIIDAAEIIMEESGK